ncbi:MAG: hypothetical protein K2I35_08855, partial [Duncaniella sp.]|nr:hypothetical protein [Duncaniella sp.]
MKRILSIVFILAAVCGVVSAKFNRITNDRFWDTVDGTPIYSQGGGIFKFTDPADGKEKYYWYGVHYCLLNTSDSPD